LIEQPPDDVGSGILRQHLTAWRTWCAVSVAVVMLFARMALEYAGNFDTVRHFARALTEVVPCPSLLITAVLKQQENEISVATCRREVEWQVTIFVWYTADLRVRLDEKPCNFGIPSLAHQMERCQPAVGLWINAGTRVDQEFHTI
jgi:hypothetical protein